MKKFIIPASIKDCSKISEDQVTTKMLHNLYMPQDILQ